jgi:hypothetical protein
MGHASFNDMLSPYTSPVVSTSGIFVKDRECLNTAAPSSLNSRNAQIVRPEELIFEPSACVMQSPSTWAYRSIKIGHLGGGSWSNLRLFIEVFD